MYEIKTQVLRGKRRAYKKARKACKSRKGIRGLNYKAKRKN